MQIAEPQQPALMVHAPPTLLQHAVPPRPLSAQVRPPPQHAVAPAVQRAPSARVHVVAGVWQVPEVHVRPVQQPDVAVHAPPEAVHAGAARQVPDWHVLPVQQSASAWHVAPRAWHAQWPPVQSICPQQS